MRQLAKTVSLICCLLILAGLISCNSIESQNPDTTPVDSAMPSDTVKPVPSDTTIPTDSGAVEAQSPSPVETSDGDEKDKQDIRDLDLENLFISDIVESKQKDAKQYPPILLRNEMAIDVDNLAADLFGTKVEPVEMTGFVEYTHDKKILDLRDSYGRKTIDYRIKGPSENAEAIGMEKDQSQSLAEEMVNLILGDGNGSQTVLDNDEEYTYKKDDKTHYFRFLHRYENGLIIDDVVGEGILVTVGKEGVRDFDASWYNFTPSQESSDIVSVADALKIVDEYIVRLGAESTPIEVNGIDLVYSNATEYLNDSRDAEWDKYALHWKISIIQRKNEGEVSYSITDSFYVNGITGSVYFTSNSL